jgi:hypothetical protein
MNSRKNILDALCSLPAGEFVSEYLFDRVPHVFDDKRATYINWKTALANAIEVDPACVTLVGSSALGISLNPKKGFKPFDEKSDIDVAIVSAFHFTVAWRYLRTNGHRRTHVDARTRIAWKEHSTRFIYWGTVATDRLLGILPFGSDWLSALNIMSGIAPTEGRDINLRIYADYESLRAYQVHSVERAREDVMAGGTLDAPVS